MKSCALGTQPALLAFSSLPDLWDTKAVSNLVSYFLKRKVLYRTDDPQMLVHRRISNTEFPFCFGGIVAILYSLSKMGHGSHKELSSAWEILEKKRDDKGRYIVNWTTNSANDRYNRLPSLGQRHMGSKWITLYVLLAKKYAGKKI